jgi:hypothetical protein
LEFTLGRLAADWEKHPFTALAWAKKQLFEAGTLDSVERLLHPDLPNQPFFAPVKQSLLADYLAALS